tara:strand:- start:201 stop:605 length:405 start_codon:yes stop_codon:yes gene_type:complete
MYQSQVPIIQDKENIYQLKKLEDNSCKHFYAKCQIIINPNDFFVFTLSGFEELGELRTDTRIVHPHFLKPRKSVHNSDVLWIPMNDKLSVIIHVKQVIDQNIINNANDDVKIKIQNKLGWLECNLYEVIAHNTV